VIPQPFQSDALHRLSLGNHDPNAMQTDAIGRLSYRANQNRKNFGLMAPPAIDTKGMPPAVAGRLGGGTPNYRNPANATQHLQGGTPYVRH
jgi:hypothetical protein